jgi:predicted metal-dependent hydrolase
MDSDLLERFAEGINKFNNGEFFECHDILEDIWFEIRGKDRNFYQGLIHLAVGFYHLLYRENPRGALSQLNKGTAKLSSYKPGYQGVELNELLEKVSVCIEKIERINKGEGKMKITVPLIHFKKKLFKIPNRD